MIYTLDYLEKEAKDIVDYWNGSDEKFVDANGSSRTEEEAAAAIELKETIENVRSLIKELGI